MNQIDPNEPPEGLEGFRTHRDISGKDWWLRSVNGWEIFARPVGVGANPDVFPMHLLTREEAMQNFGVNLDAIQQHGPGWELQTNSSKLADIALGRTDSEFPTGGVQLDGETIQQEDTPPWERPIEPQFNLDLGWVIPAAILGLAIVLAVAIRVVFRR